jgi:hypothetical protein
MFHWVFFCVAGSRVVKKESDEDVSTDSWWLRHFWGATSRIWTSKAHILMVPNSLVSSYVMSITRNAMRILGAFSKALTLFDLNFQCRIHKLHL